MLTTFENSKPEISCIYVNYRSAALLEHSLQSLLQYEKTTPFEVIIVNNDPKEEKEVQALEKKYNLTILEAFHNPGFGTAANMGAQAATGELLFFINPDTLWRESFFQNIQKLFINRKELGAVGIQLVSEAGIPETNNAGQALAPSKFFRKKNIREKIEWLSGGALFIPKKVFQEAGGFDEQFFMYFEDMDLCLRLQKMGYQLFLHTDQSLVHFGGASHVSKKSQKKIYDQSLYRYTKKHWPFFQHLFFRLTHPVYRFFFPYGR